MRIKIQYYVILTVDVYKESCHNLSYVKPQMVKYPKFKVTETEVEESDYYKTHRKYCGLLYPEELNELLMDEFTDTCKTMGSITDIGHLPAISFNDNSDNCYKNAYVSPILDFTDENKLLGKLEDHPNAEEIKQRVGYKLDQILDVLENFYDTEKVGKSFFVDTKQLYLNFN